MKPDRIIVLPSIGSTLDWIKDNPSQVRLNQTIVRANVQHQGRGQRGRVWKSAAGGLYFSMALNPVLEEGWDLRLIQSFSQNVVHWLQARGIQARLKFPNDVLVGDKKLMGVLVETVFWGQDLKYCTMGCGLNVQQIEGDLPPGSVSLAMLGLNILNLNDLVLSLLFNWHPLEERLLCNP